MIVVVTGGTGFFGSHLIRGLLDNGHHVILLKRSTSNVWRISEFISQIDIFDLDISPLSSLYDKYPKIDACIHTATDYGLYKGSLNNIFYTNVSLPFSLLTSMHNSRCDLFINTDTFYMLSNNKNNYFHMRDYIISKQYIKELGTSFSALKKIKFINMRLFHLYGTMDNEKKFSVSMIDKLTKGIDIELTDGLQCRDFIYVKDAVKAFIVVLEAKINQNEQYDVGTGKLISIREFVETLKIKTKSNSKLLFGLIETRGNESEVSNISANVHKLNKLGWFPKVSLEKGIELIVDYSMRHLNK